MGPDRLAGVSGDLLGQGPGGYVPLGLDGNEESDAATNMS